MHPHRRFDPLSGQWVLVSPHRMRRPWQGQTVSAPREHRPVHDPGCYLCPGNQRAAEHRNPVYDSTFVFTNDFAALLPEGPAEEPLAEAGHERAPMPAVGDGHPLLHAEPVRGTCRVLCFSPRHDLTLAEMDAPGRRAVVDLWAAQTAALGRAWRYNLFETSFPHSMGWHGAPHGHGDHQHWQLHAHFYPPLTGACSTRWRSCARATRSGWATGLEPAAHVCAAAGGAAIVSEEENP